MKKRDKKRKREEKLVIEMGSAGKLFNKSNNAWR